MKEIGITRREFVRSLRLLAVAPLAIPLCACSGSSSSSSRVKMGKCPFCGKETKQSTLDWQGMCDRCNKNREDANALLESAQ